MPSTRHPFVAVALAMAAAAQDVAENAAAIQVGRARFLLEAKETEEALLVLWEVLAAPAHRPGDAEQDAARTAAAALLAAHDGNDEHRRGVFATVARQQVELAALYRGRKWLELAADRLAVAAAFDRDATAREHSLLVTASGKGKASAPPAAPLLSPLLKRENTLLASEEWREVGGVLEAQPPKGGHIEWVCKATHADHDVVVEFRPADASKEFHAILAVGLGILPGSNNFSGYRFLCKYVPEAKRFELTMFAVRGMQIDTLGSSTQAAPQSLGGPHRLSIQVRGERLQARLNRGKPLTVDASAPVRGHVGLLLGALESHACTVQFRDFRIEPPPAAGPASDGQDAAAVLGEVGTAVAAAKRRLAEKQHEAAALELYEAAGLAATLPAGRQRDEVVKAVERLLAQADPFAARRQKAAQAIAAELVALAEPYARAGMARAAAALVERASAFDPQGQSARLAAARAAVEQWRQDQVVVRAPELAPPADDGAALREWFAKGRKLDAQAMGMMVHGAEARVLVPHADESGWLPALPARPLARASVHVHLTVTGEGAGFCFDVVDHREYAAIWLHRTETGMELVAATAVAGSTKVQSRREVPIADWRRDGWHVLRVEATPAGLVASCGPAQLEVRRSTQEKPVFGLYATNLSGSLQGIEFRAFQPLP